MLLQKFLGTIGVLLLPFFQNVAMAKCPASVDCNLTTLASGFSPLPLMSDYTSTKFWNRAKEVQALDQDLAAAISKVTTLDKEYLKKINSWVFMEEKRLNDSFSFATQGKPSRITALKIQNTAIKMLKNNFLEPNILLQVIVYSIHALLDSDIKNINNSPINAAQCSNFLGTTNGSIKLNAAFELFAMDITHITNQLVAVNQKLFNSNLPRNDYYYDYNKMLKIFNFWQFSMNQIPCFKQATNTCELFAKTINHFLDQVTPQDYAQKNNTPVNGLCSESASSLTNIPSCCAPH